MPDVELGNALCSSSCIGHSRLQAAAAHVSTPLAVALGLSVLAGEPLAAHEAGVPAAGDAPFSPWDGAALVLLAFAGLLYAAGSWRLSRRGAYMRPIERGCFWIGWSVMMAALAPPLDTAASWTFSAHMAQHELLMLAGAPLMIVGRPIVPWLWALPSAVRGRAGSGLTLQPITAVWRVATMPVAAWALHGLIVWIWHAPVFYEAALRSEAIHALQHATFVATAVCFWWGLVYGRYGRAGYGAAVLYVFTTMVHTGVLGAAFALSTAPFYGIYEARAAAAGVDAVADQQLAGLYMWIPAGIVLMVSGLALLVAWLAESERRTRAAGILALALVAGGMWSCKSLPHAQDARQLTGGDPHRGRERIRYYGCDSCHTIPGVATADATVGPPLTQVARRMYLAGRLTNTPENMMAWIEHPRAIDEKTAMPEVGVTPEDSRDIAAFLYTMR